MRRVYPAIAAAATFMPRKGGLATLMHKPLPLPLIDAFEPLADRWRVSEVARGLRTPALRGDMPRDWPRSFMLVYRRAGGDLDGMPQWWREERERFIGRHMAQVKANGEPLFRPDGLPTRRHLGLIFWAWSPHPARLARLAERAAKPAPNPATERTRPALWRRIVEDVRAGGKGGRPGEWSARKAQRAVRLYEAAGGGYVGPKPEDNALARWTRQQWTTRSGRPSLESGERYLPAAAWAALSPQEAGATTRAKRAGLARGEQYTAQPPGIAAKVRKYRR